ncbi:ABC transporter permease [Velocimicrobium porci]|uniref:ABC transporter permease n=1 Tax=Velocimicrobium porci TaxID=2606634 RepID=A0A6L5XZL0_9FIRM|nr:ABC transporter permease [Velocimicrobium porci]MSS64007.1 ABC transporter permease [Velocimicrobium porci]
MELSSFLSIIQGILEQGFIYGIVALGIYITYHILDFPDLSVDGTFPLGSAVTAVLLIHGVNPWLTILISFLAGACAGFLTGFFHVVLKIKDLLAGIITMTGLYSINLMITGYSPLLQIGDAKTIFNSGFLANLSNSFGVWKTFILIFLNTIVIKLFLDWYFKTKSGFLLRAAGDNENMITMLAQDKGKVKIIGLMLCNGLSATAGSVLCQQQRYFDSNSGTGMLVMGLASVIIGMTLLGKLAKIKGTTMVIFGAVLYKACIAVALNLRINPNNLKLIMAIIFLIALVSKDLFRKGGKQHASSDSHL